MQLNEFFLKFLDKESMELQSIMQAKAGKFAGTGERTGSTAAKPIVLDLGVVGSIRGTKGFEIRQTHEKNLVGFDAAGGKRFYKFVESIYKNPAINNALSQEFIEGIAWEWMYEYKINRTNQTFTEFLVDKSKLAIESIKIHFPIIGLEIDEPFYIGDVEFGFFTPEYFQAYSDAVDESVSNSKESYEYYKKHYSGTVYCATVMEAEKKMATDVALIPCSIAVDILRICSRTLGDPLASLGFDINRRLTYSDGIETIYEYSDKNKGV